MINEKLLRIGFVFEGTTDEETIPILVTKLLGRPVEVVRLQKEASGFDDFKRRKQGNNPALNQAWGMFKSYVIGLLIKGVDAVIVVVDNDQQPAHKRWCMLGKNLPFHTHPVKLVDVSQLKQACEQLHLDPGVLECIDAPGPEGDIPVVIGIAVEMLEAWLLAQPHLVESVLWEPISSEERARCAEPEKIPHPKKEVIKPHNGGGDLSRKQARQIGQHPDFTAGPVESACPSFALFASNVRVLK